MTVEIRRAVEADLPELHALDRRNFGVTAPATEQDINGDMLEVDRFLVAVDGGDMVAIAGSFAMEATVPTASAGCLIPRPDEVGATGRAGGTVPMSGVTWVSVAASHRRQGILTRLMAGLDDMAAELDEPLLGLTASEGAIYERFGYGVATRYRTMELDRRRAQIHPRYAPEPVRLIDASDHLDELRAIYDRYRLVQHGEVSRSEALFRDQNIDKGQANFAAIHPDGYTIWTVEPNWNYGHPGHVLFIKDFIAVTPEARVALWHILLSVDLVGPIRSIRSATFDDPLGYLLTDPRALRTVESNDAVWLKVTDPVRCFDARAFRTDDRLVIGILDGGLDGGDMPNGEPTQRVAISAKGCESTDDPIDIIADRSALGPLLMGVNASQLAGGRRLNADAETLVRADLMFGTGRMAHCRTAF